MTMVRCKGCGGDIHYSNLAFCDAGDECSGLCFECYFLELRSFVKKKIGAWEEFRKFVEERVGVKNGEDCTML